MDKKQKQKQKQIKLCTERKSNLRNCALSVWIWGLKAEKKAQITRECRKQVLCKGRTIRNNGKQGEIVVTEFEMMKFLAT